MLLAQAAVVRLQQDRQGQTMVLVVLVVLDLILFHLGLQSQELV
jgi:hypothetical protein